MPKLPDLFAEVKFFHGWAYRAESWQSWRKALSGGSNSFEFYDRGYFGNPISSSPFLEGDHHKIVIAHSLGLHFIPADILRDARWIVMIGSFKHFHEFGANSPTSFATTRAMRKRLRKNAGDVLRDFYKQSGEVLNLSFETQLNVDQLVQDLHLLDSVHYDVASHPEGASTLMLHGAADLVSDSLHASTFKNLLSASTLCIHPSANHSLPFTEFEWCHKQLAEFCPAVFAVEPSKAVSHAG